MESELLMALEGEVIGVNEYKVEVNPRGKVSKNWYLNGLQHRTDGPAVEYSDGTKVWYSNGKLHREDGPAIEYADGGMSWYLNGKRIAK